MVHGPCSGKIYLSKIDSVEAFPIILFLYSLGYYFLSQTRRQFKNTALYYNDTVTPELQP